MRLSALFLLPLLATACVKQPVALYMDDQEGGETGHYVLIAAKMNGSLKVYDCMSRPDGSSWDPVCQKVPLRNEVPTDR